MYARLSAKNLAYNICRGEWSEFFKPLLQMRKLLQDIPQRYSKPLSYSHVLKNSSLHDTWKLQI